MSDATIQAELPVALEDRPFGRSVLGLFPPVGIAARIALAAAVAVACLIFAAGSKLFNIPALPGFDGSLFLQSSPMAAVALIGILLLVATLVGTVVAGALHFEAGLFAATFGLIIVSLRCGTIQSVLFESGGKPSVFATLVLEMFVLGLILAIAWLMLRQIARIVHGSDVSAPPGKSSILNSLTATIAQTVITAVIIMILCQSEAKNQCLASVGLGSLIGSVIAYRYASTRPSYWYWAGPLVVAIVGYGLAAAGQDTGLTIGSPAGMFAALARPLPVDYAGIGVAGAIFGYWASRKPASSN